jgi:predicted nucleic acid-binding protein
MEIHRRNTSQSSLSAAGETMSPTIRPVPAIAPSQLLTDAVLAAPAVEHGGTLVSTDRSFARFAELTWVNPLVQ